nr:hypothetical protein GZ9D1_30 [uncultured archaeon GZfos9D1]
MFLVKVFTEGKKVVGKAFLSKKSFSREISRFFHRDNALSLSLSFSSNFFITTLEGCMGRGTSDKSDLATTTPSTVIRSRFKSTVLTFPSLPLSSPRTTVTVSPFLTGTFLFAYLPCRSSERGALMNLCLTCRGALYLAFLCFLGCLDFISFQLLKYSNIKGCVICGGLCVNTI